MSYNVVDQSTGDLEQIAGSTLTAIYADSPLGVILPFGGSIAPTGFLICDGSAVSRTTYAALFAVIGTKFGSGDGSTTFNLPSHDFGANLYPNVEAKYIIKAIATALPSDIQEQLDDKQNVTDNSLETTSKTVPEAINELHSALKDKIELISITNEETESTAGNSTLTYEIPAANIPAEKTVVGINVVGTTPKSSWDTVAHPQYVNVATKTITLRTIGSTSQKYRIDYDIFVK